LCFVSLKLLTRVIVLFVYGVKSSCTLPRQPLNQLTHWPQQVENQCKHLLLLTWGAGPSSSPLIWLTWQWKAAEVLEPGHKSLSFGPGLLEHSLMELWASGKNSQLGGCFAWRDRVRSHAGWSWTTWKKRCWPVPSPVAPASQEHPGHLRPALPTVQTQNQYILASEPPVWRSVLSLDGIVYQSASASGLCSVSWSILVTMPYCFNYCCRVWDPDILFFKTFLLFLHIVCPNELWTQQVANSVSKDRWDFNWYCIQFVQYFKVNYFFYITECFSRGTYSSIIHIFLCYLIQFYTFHKLVLCIICYLFLGFL
jgi:hypothetical protein